MRQVGASEIGSTQDRVPKVRIGALRTPKIRGSEITCPQVAGFEEGTGKICSVSGATVRREPYLVSGEGGGKVSAGHLLARELSSVRASIGIVGVDESDAAKHEHSRPQQDACD